MTDFIRALAKHVTDAAKRLPEGQTWKGRMAIDGVRDVLENKPDDFAPAVQAALDECNLTLTPKGP